MYPNWAFKHSSQDGKLRLKTDSQNLVKMNAKIWLFPVLFLIHDLEEILTVKGFMNSNKDRIVSLLSPKIGTSVQKQFDLTTVQFSVSVAFVFIFVISSTYLATHYNFAEGALRYFFIIVAIFFVHVFTHVGQALTPKYSWRDRS